MIDNFFIFGASYLFLASPFAAFLVFIGLSREEKKQMIILTILASILALALAIAMREIYFNPRPFVIGGFEPLVTHKSDNGFPSDHTLLVATIASIIGFFHRRAALYLWLIVILVGISRIYVGVHHLIDVVGSILISIATALIAYATIRLWNRRNQTNS